MRKSDLTKPSPEAAEWSIKNMQNALKLTRKLIKEYEKRKAENKQPA